MNVYKYGLRKRPLFDQISNSFNFKSKIKYPDRTSKFLRNSHELSNLLDGDGEGLFELEEQQRRQNREIEKQNMIREIAETIRVSTTDIRDALSRIERSDPLYPPSFASDDFYDTAETQATPGATGSQSSEPPKTKLEIEAYVRPSDFKVPLSYNYWNGLTIEQIRSFLKVNYYQNTKIKSNMNKFETLKTLYEKIAPDDAILESEDLYKEKYTSKTQEEQDRFSNMAETHKSAYTALVHQAKIKAQKFS